MYIRQIDDEYAVAGQITIADLEEIKALGFKAIVCNRPDGEEPGQTPFAEISAHATALGLEARHVPVGPMGVDSDAVSGMVDALDELPRPLLGYCRSGSRSTIVYEKTHHMRG